MASPFLALPPELRERVYEYVALAHTTRRVSESFNYTVRRPEFKTSTSGLTATCRLIRREYEQSARRATRVLEIAAPDMAFYYAIDYFRRHVDEEYLAILQGNNAAIRVNMIVYREWTDQDQLEFYQWALFLIHVRLRPEYYGNFHTRVAVFTHLNSSGFLRRLTAQRIRSEVLRHHEKEILKIAEHLKETVRIRRDEEIHKLERGWDRQRRHTEIAMSLSLFAPHMSTLSEIEEQRASFFQLLAAGLVFRDS